METRTVVAYSLLLLTALFVFGGAWYLRHNSATNKALRKQELDRKRNNVKRRSKDKS